MPGLFITGTDTGVGKTLVTCGIAAAMRPRLRGRLGVCKPMSSGCRREREGLVHPDAEALAHFADCRLPLDVINPIRFRPPLAPAVAADAAGVPIEWEALQTSLRQLEKASDFMLVEGVGGVMVPLDPGRPRLTVIDLIGAMSLPVVIVCRSVLGTLNHTAMTVAVLERAGCRVAGLVMNGYDAEDASDPSIATNRQWMERLTGRPVLATVPRLAPERARVDEAVLDDAAIEALAGVDWSKA